MIFYSPSGIIISFGVGFAYYIRRQSRAKQRNELKFPRLLLCLTADVWGLVGYYYNNMRKHLLFFVLMLVPMLAIADASGTCGENLTWTFETATGTLTISGTGAMNDYDYKGNNRRPWPSDITTVVIEDGVTSIGSFAFYNCTQLPSVTIPSSVTEIREAAFSGCDLTSVTIPNSIMFLFKNAFACQRLEKVEINSNTLMGYNHQPSSWNTYYPPFSEIFGQQVKEYVLGNSITTIGAYAFYNSTSITSIIIPSNIKRIESGAFDGCTSLTSIHITDLSAWCGIEFQNEGSNPLNYRDIRLYQNDEEIKDLVIPSNVPSIANYAFFGYKGLTSVTISDGVTSIGNETFAGCSSLVSVTIGNSVTSLGDNAFEGTAWYNNQPDGVVYAGKNIYRYKGTMPENTSIAIEDGTYSVTSDAFKRCTNLASIIIPNSVTTIGSSVFSGCSGLTSASISNSVTTIPERMFYNCTGLTSITIPSSVTSIGRDAFGRCSSLTSMTFLCETIDAWFYNSYRPPLTEITLGEGVKIINDYAFSGFADVKTVDIGSTVTSIGVSAFSGTNKLTDVTCRAINVPEIDRTTFANSYPNYATLHVPAVSLTAYKEMATWNEFKEIVAIKQDLPVDAEQCATPTISYQNGKLSFASVTEGVKFIYQITDNDIKSGFGAEVSLDATYHISVYATKEGYKDSETATATLCWIEQKPATEGITDGIANVPVKALLIKNNGGLLTIEGAADGEAISVYTVNGVQSGSAISQNGAASINAKLQAGSIAIVKIGNKSVKVVIK